ncbi:hypothetical protein BBC0244_018010 [Bartonella apihabitans]|nr:hypothetical protein BBC0244_018010 [Bartonella apihabitans]
MIIPYLITELIIGFFWSKRFFISADIKIKLGCGVHRPKEKIGLEDKNGKTLPPDYLKKH